MASEFITLYHIIYTVFILSIVLGSIKLVLHIRQWDTQRKVKQKARASIPQTLDIRTQVYTCVQTVCPQIDSSEILKVYCAGRAFKASEELASALQEVIKCIDTESISVPSFILQAISEELHA